MCAIFSTDELMKAAWTPSLHILLDHLRMCRHNNYPQMLTANNRKHTLLILDAMMNISLTFSQLCRYPIVKAFGTEHIPSPWSIWVVS